MSDLMPPQNTSELPVGIGSDAGRPERFQFEEMTVWAPLAHCKTGNGWYCSIYGRSSTNSTPHTVWIRVHRCSAVRSLSRCADTLLLVRKQCRRKGISLGYHGEAGVPC